MRADKSALNLQKGRQKCSLLPVGEDKQNSDLPLAWVWKAFSKCMPPGFWILKRNLWLVYLGKLGRSLKCLFFLRETALWQVTWQGHSGWCETGGTTAQDCIWGAEPLGGGDPVIWHKGQQQHSTVTSPDPCFYTESIKERTAQPQEPWHVLSVYSMLKCKFKVQ